MNGAKTGWLHTNYAPLLSEDLEQRAMLFLDIGIERSFSNSHGRDGLILAPCLTRCLGAEIIMNFSSVE